MTHAMTGAQTNQPIEAGVYDPSHRNEGGYWQWRNVHSDKSWEDAAALVHEGWPEKADNFDNQNAVLYGVMGTGAGCSWFYRVYPAGRDRFGRPGRYFFVLLRLHSPEQMLDPEVAGLLRYFDAERSLPLETAPLNRGFPNEEPDDLLRKLCDVCKGGRQDGHWGMDNSGIVTIFSFTSPAPKTPAAIPPLSTSKRMTSDPRTSWIAKKSSIGGPIIWIAGILLVLGIVVVFNSLRPPPDNTNDSVDPSTRPPRPIPSESSSPERGSSSDKAKSPDIGKKESVDFDSAPPMRPETKNNPSQVVPPVDGNITPDPGTEPAIIPNHP